MAILISSTMSTTTEVRYSSLGLPCRVYRVTTNAELFCTISTARLPHLSRRAVFVLLLTACSLEVSDAETREALSAPAASFCIEAPAAGGSAGSGKAWQQSRLCHSSVWVVPQGCAGKPRKVGRK